MPAAARARRRPVRGLLELHPRPPFRLDLTVWALRRREQNQIDTWDGGRYRRVLLADGVPVELTVTQAGPPSAPRLELTLGGGAPDVCDRGCRPLDVALGCSASRSTSPDSTRAPAATGRSASSPSGSGASSHPRFPTLFECLLNAVACQQLSLAGGPDVAQPSRRGSRTSGRRACTRFPAPADVRRLPHSTLRAIGFSQRKAETIRELAAAAAAGEFELTRSHSSTTRRCWTHSSGGAASAHWSADYLLLRGLGRLHVFPRGDVGALNGLRDLLTVAGQDDNPQAALARFGPDAGLVYFHLLLRGLEQRGLLDRP